MSKRTCPTCGGSGKTTVRGGPNTISGTHDVKIDCPRCGGSGRIDEVDD